MPTDAQILTLAQWFSPAFPVGAFAYSHGLEWAITNGDVHSFDTLEEWITQVLDHGSGRADATFLAAAFKAETPDEVAEIDAFCRAFAASSERLKESTLQGEAFCTTVASVWNAELSGLYYPVAAGRAARLADLPAVLSAQMFLFAFMSSLVSVGMRLIPLGQSNGQRMIHALTPLCARIAQDTAHGDLDTLGSTCFNADIAAMKHETQYSRVFRT